MKKFIKEEWPVLLFILVAINGIVLTFVHSAFAAGLFAIIVYLVVYAITNKEE